MSCADHIGLNCSVDVNQCASIECAECVKICGKEDSWVVSDGLTTQWMFKEWSVAQFMQSYAIVNSLGQSAVYGYFPFFTATNVTSSSIVLSWSFFQQVTIYPVESFQIEIAPATESFTALTNVLPTQTGYTITSAEYNLSPRTQYVIRLKIMDATGNYIQGGTESVQLLVTIPY